MQGGSSSALSSLLDDIAYGLTGVNACLSNTCIRNENLQQVTQCVRMNGGVQHLDLSCNQITARGVSLLCEQLLEDNSVLVELVLSHNPIGTAGAERLIQVILDGKCALRSISLEDTEMPPNLRAELEEVVQYNGQPPTLRKCLFQGFVHRRACNGGSESEITFLNDEMVDEIDLADQEGKLSFTLLARGLKACPEVSRLSLSNCAIFDSGLRVILPAIAEAPALKYVDLSKNGLTSHGLEELAAALAHNQTIKELLLCDNRAGDPATRAFIKTLVTNNALQRIDFSDCSVTEISKELLGRELYLNTIPLKLKHAAHALSTDDPNVESVELQWVTGASMAADILGPLLRGSTHLKVLNLSNAGFGDDGAKVLAPGLKINTSLQMLELTNNALTEIGVFPLLEAISSHQSLKEINLCGNRFGDKVAQAFIKILKMNRRLTAVRLELNYVNSALIEEVERLCNVNMQPAAVRDAVASLEANDINLKVLDFSKFGKEEYLTSDSVRVLCEALSTKASIRLIDLSHNPLSDIGALHLARWLSKGRAGALEIIRICDTGISDQGALQILCELRQCMALREIAFSENPVGEPTGEALLDMIATCAAPLDCIELKRTRVSEQTAERIAKALETRKEPLCLAAALARLEKSKGGVVIDLSERAAREGGARAGAEGAAVRDSTICMFWERAKGDRRVHTLILDGAVVGPDGVSYIADMLADSACGIDHISFYNCKTFNDECACILAESISKNSTLEELDLEGTAITDTGVRALVHALDANPALKRCSVSEGCCSLQTSHKLQHALLDNKQLPHIRELLHRVRSADPTLTNLELRGGTNNLDDEEELLVDDIVIGLLAEDLASNTIVQRIDLSHNAITSGGVESLANALSQNYSATHLDLSYNSITDEGCTALARLLSFNDTLVVVKLEGNVGISMKAKAEVEYMANINAGPLQLKAKLPELAANSKSLKVLEFNYRAARDLRMPDRVFDDNAVHVLCSVLANNTNVLSLDLANNRITDEGAKSLARMLLVNKTLRDVFLENNYITDAGGLKLRASLKSNVSIHRLALGGNLVSPLVIGEIEALLHVNRSKLPYNADDISRDSEFGLNENESVDEAINEQPKSRPRPKTHSYYNSYRTRPPPDEDFVLFRDPNYYRLMEDAILEDAMAARTTYSRAKTSKGRNSSK